VTHRSPSIAIVAFAVLAGCGDAETSSRLDVERDPDGNVERATATWTYRSGEVDVDLTLNTDYSETTCTTTARLFVNDAASKAETHVLDDTACSVLALTEEGDIVLREIPTGHDWSSEPLHVDTENERIELGPWTPDAAGAVTYRFTLSSPPCGDDCECPVLRGRAGGHESVLELGRRCD
jgi:hypothetical protein